jgi:hypothetical protein
MNTANTEQSQGLQVPCCPQLEPCEVCDTVDFPYRLSLPEVVETPQRQVVTVEVTLRFRLTRCAGPLSQGDLLYTTTLLPGEQVRLFTSDRHTRFSFDTESKLAYRHQTTSEESFFLAGMANAVSNVTSVETRGQASTFHESAINGGASAGIDLGFVSFGGSVSGSSHDAQSASVFADHISRHADSSSRQVEVGVRAASSTAVGEVASRTHTQSESEDHFESASRTFTNPNHCRALTFLFYRIDKCQTITWDLIAIDRRVVDPAAPTGVSLNPVPNPSRVAPIPTGVLATSGSRLEVERAARTSAQEEVGAVESLRAVLTTGATAVSFIPAPIPIDVRRAALKQADAELESEGLLDASGNVAASAKERLRWTRTISLPTPGVLVRGCLDQCAVCEPDVERSIQLDLAHKELENELLKRQIELLDQSQQYRCCPDSDESGGASS